MIDMKNIFIEGIQGTGKSTLANSLSKAFPKFHVCREGDYSPVELAWCTWMSKDDYHGILKCYAPIRDDIIKNTVQENENFVVSYTKILTDIPNFHKDLEQYEVYNGRKTFQDLKELIFTRYRNFKETGYLFECSFFQNIIEDLMLFHLLDDDEIVEFYRELYCNIHKDSFLLLYLYSNELEESINAIKKERCDDLGNELWYPMMLQFFIHSPYGMKHECQTFHDMMTHFEHRQQLELRIIKEIVRDRAMILPAKEWDITRVSQMPCICDTPSQTAFF